MKKVLLVMSIVFVLTFAMATVAYATGASAAPAPAPTNSVSQVITGAVDEVKAQTETIFFDVIVWALRAIGVIVLIVFIAMAGITKHKGENINFVPIVVTFVVLVVLFILPEALWNLVG